MNDTTVRYPAGLADAVAAYVREVRVELADLPLEDVDDLTGGMEADLSELAAESGGDLIGRLGSPRLYAAELRAAAGLPERAAGSGRRRRRSLGEQAALDRASFTRLTERHPWLRSVTAFLVTLRPAWWVLRGYLAVWALWSLSMGMRGIGPHDVIHFTAAIAAIVVSVRVGQGWLQERALTRPLLVLANAAAVIVTLIASTAGVTSGEGNFYEATYTPPPGLLFDGQAVANVYAYDSEGQRITAVRLFGQDGRPLDGDQSSTDGNGSPIGQDVNGNPMAVRDSNGTPLMNVYPRALFGSDPWQVTDPANPQLNPPPPVWTLPMSIVPLASSVTPTATPTPTPTSTVGAPAPTATSKPAPTKSASPTPPSGPTPTKARP